MLKITEALFIWVETGLSSIFLNYLITYDTLMLRPIRNVVVGFILFSLQSLLTVVPCFSAMAPNVSPCFILWYLVFALLFCVVLLLLLLLLALLLLLVLFDEAYLAVLDAPEVALLNTYTSSLMHLFSKSTICSGLIASPIKRNSKCRCDPLDLPVFPPKAIT